MGQFMNRKLIPAPYLQHLIGKLHHKWYVSVGDTKGYLRVQDDKGTVVGHIDLAKEVLVIYDDSRGEIEPGVHAVHDPDGSWLT